MQTILVAVVEDRQFAIRKESTPVASSALENREFVFGLSSHAGTSVSSNPIATMLW